jgi:glucose/arabinose dehydrogenase
MRDKIKYYLGLGFIGFLVLAALVSDHFKIWPFSENLNSQPTYLINPSGSSPENQVANSQSDEPGIVEARQINYQIEPVVSGLNVPWSIVFTSPTRMLVSERPGQVRVVENDKLLPNPLHIFADAESEGEAGLMGMAADPNYSSNQFIYACYAYQNTGQMKTRVVRLRDTGTALVEQKVLLENIPAARNHAGCELGFGPDGKLYVSTGDASTRDIAQDRSSLGGKILRINPDGTIPADNPFTGSPIWTLGHRNSQGFDWHPGTQVLYATEHGPSGFDGQGGGDEVNIIEKGNNYGWPLVSHQQTRQGLIDPKLVFTPAIAPGSAVFYDSQVIPEFTNNLFFGLLRGQGIMRVVVDVANPWRIVLYEKLPGIDVGRVREMTVGPDGHLYFTTSNRDGRAPVRDGDDHIFRLVPR